MTDIDKIFDDFCALAFNKRKEAFALEKHYLLFCFTLWVHWRHLPHQLSAGLHACSARILLELFQRNQSNSTKKRQADYEKAVQLLFDIQKIAQQVLDREHTVPHGDDLEISMDYQSYAATIGWFLATCEPNAKNARLRPSINKAVYFSMNRHQASRAQVFREWSSTGDMSPFIAASSANDSAENVFVSPWDKDAIAKATEITKNPKRIREYLQLALYIQERIIDVLDKRSKEKRNFVVFPSYIPRMEFELEPWSADDERLLKLYESEKLKARSQPA